MGRSRRASFRYTRAQERAILRTLEADLLPRVDRRDVLDAVTGAARIARAQRDFPARPYMGDAVWQLRRVAEASDTLRKACGSLHWLVEARLHAMLAETYIEPALESTLRPLYQLGPTRLHHLLDALKDAAKQTTASINQKDSSFPYTGRRPATALQAFISRLCMIYHIFTERPPGLTRPTGASFTRGRFYPFVVAAVGPTKLATATELDHSIRVSTDAFRKLLGVPKRSHAQKVKTSRQ